jgi:hypothetical protein
MFGARQQMMLTNGNNKIGNITGWDILPGKAFSCPGATKTCEKICYAVQMGKQYKHVAAKQKENLRSSKTSAFVPWMIQNIPSAERTPLFRIHANAGDFYSAGYIRKWVKIVMARRDIHFYCYTRSWRRASLLKELLALAKQPNVVINLSVDKESGIPTFKSAQHFMWCYLAVTDDENIPDLGRDGLVFRHQHKYDMRHASRNKGPVHELGGNIVCPLERSTKTAHGAGLTCETCLICV